MNRGKMSPTEESRANQDLLISTPKNKISTTYAKVPLSQMQDYLANPFCQYTDERKTDMIDSITKYGILSPILLREMDNGELCILSGHNRKHCAMEAGLTEADAVIIKHLTDEDALIYLVESNLMQRSFSDFLPSEKIFILSLRQSKLFSEKKRAEIKETLVKLENSDGDTENPLLSGIRTVRRTDAKLGEEYGLSRSVVAQYLKMKQLIPQLLCKLDMGSLVINAAYHIAFLSKEEQKALNQVMELNGFKVDIKKSEILREYARQGKLNEDEIYCILNGERRKPGKKRNPTVIISRRDYDRFFAAEMPRTQVQQIVSKALEEYFERNPGTGSNGKKRSAPKKSRAVDDAAVPMLIDEMKQDAGRSR